MPVPSDIASLSTTAGSNSPPGSESPTTTDDYLRALSSFIAQHRDGAGFTQEATVASAATADIGAASSLYVQITGTTTITSFGTAYNGPRFVRFAGILTLTHNATTLILPGGANITTAAGDRAILRPVGNPASGWQVLAYEIAALAPGAANTATTAGTLSGTVAIANGGTGQTTAAAAIAGLFGTRVDVASAATVDLSSVVSSINITGTTTITAFTVAAGRLIFVRFNASLTLTNNANIVTQTGANIVTAAGDTCVLRATAANTVEVLGYVSSVANRQSTFSRVKVQGNNGYGSTNTVVRRFTSITENTGTDITYADSATLGATFTVNTAGRYTITYVDNFTAAADAQITRNSTALNTLNGDFGQILAEGTTGASGHRACLAWSGFLSAGDVMRAQTVGTAGSNSRNFFDIQRVL